MFEAALASRWNKLCSKYECPASALVQAIFTLFLKKLCNHNQHEHRPWRSADFKRHHLLKPKKNNLFLSTTNTHNSMVTQATKIFHENLLEGTAIFIWRARPRLRHPEIS